MGFLSSINRGQKDHFPRPPSLPKSVKKLLPIFPLHPPPYPQPYHQHQFSETNFMMSFVPIYFSPYNMFRTPNYWHSKLHKTFPFFPSQQTLPLCLQKYCCVSKILLFLNPFSKHSFHLTALMKIWMSSEDTAPPKLCQMGTGLLSFPQHYPWVWRWNK